MKRGKRRRENGIGIWIEIGLEEEAEEDMVEGGFSREGLEAGGIGEGRLSAGEATSWRYSTLIDPLGCLYGIVYITRRRTAH